MKLPTREYSSDCPPERLRHVKRAVRCLGIVVAALTVSSSVHSDAVSQVDSIAVQELYGVKMPNKVSKTRLLPPVSPPDGEGGYKFINVAPDGRPATWDPCRPIGLVVNSKGAPERGLHVIEQAVQDIEEATGLDFQYYGSTDEAIQSNRPMVDRQRYGEVWAPVLIDWTSPRSYPLLARKAAIASPDVVVQRTGSKYIFKYVTGHIALNKDTLAEVMANPNGEAWVTAAIRHELGHLVGADHVDDPSQLMFEGMPELPGEEFGDGDLRVLARLGAGECHPDMP